MKTILISGANGFIATAFMKQFSSKYIFIKLSHKEQKGHVTLQELQDNQNLINSIDVIINLAGANIGAKRWSAKRKTELIDSRVQTTQQLVTIFNQSLNKPHFISASAVGIYEPNKDSDESTVINYTKYADFSQEITKRWESAAAQYEESLTITRFGVVLDGDGGAFSQMLRPFLFFVGGELGSGKQYFPWIAITDLLHALDKIIELKQTGIYNLVAPEMTTNHDLSSIISEVWHRPNWFRMPVFLIKLLFGQMGEELFLNSLKIHPQRLLQEKFDYKYPKLTDCLIAIKSNKLSVVS